MPYLKITYCGSEIQIHCKTFGYLMMLVEGLTDAKHDITVDCSGELPTINVVEGEHPSIVYLLGIISEYLKSFDDAGL